MVGVGVGVDGAGVVVVVGGVVVVDGAVVVVVTVGVAGTVAVDAVDVLWELSVLFVVAFVESPLFRVTRTAIRIPTMTARIPAATRAESEPPRSGWKDVPHCGQNSAS